AGTRLHLPDEPLPATGPANPNPIIEVTTQSTLTAARRLGDGTAALVFASARNPGGGFRTGARAQEEDIARASALHACLDTPPAFSPTPLPPPPPRRPRPASPRRGHFPPTCRGPPRRPRPPQAPPPPDANAGRGRPNPPRDPADPAGRAPPRPRRARAACAADPDRRRGAR